MPFGLVYGQKNVWITAFTTMDLIRRSNKFNEIYKPGIVIPLGHNPLEVWISKNDKPKTYQP